MLITDDSASAQSLNSANVTSNAIFSHFIVNEIRNI